MNAEDFHLLKMSLASCFSVAMIRELFKIFAFIVSHYSQHKTFLAPRLHVLMNGEFYIHQNSFMHEITLEKFQRNLLPPPAQPASTSNELLKMAKLNSQLRDTNLIVKLLCYYLNGNCR